MAHTVPCYLAVMSDSECIRVVSVETYLIKIMNDSVFNNDSNICVCQLCRPFKIML